MLENNMNELGIQTDALGRDRIVGLDSLRGIAAIAVMLMHFGPAYNLYRGGHDDRIYVWMAGGGYGVSLFFIISGFVIPMTLERAKGVGEFAFARWARLFPVFWFSIAFTQLCLWASPTDQEKSWEVVLVNLTMFPSHFGFTRVSGVFWTLEVELIFYFLVSFAILLKQNSRLVTFLAVLVFADVVLRLGSRFLEMNIESPMLLLVRGWLILDHLYLFLIGAVLYAARSEGFRWYHGVCLMIAITDSRLGRGGANLLITVFFSLLVYISTTRQIRFLQLKPLVFLGTISYSLYLLHPYVGYLVIDYGYQIGLNGNVSFAIAVLLAFLISAAVSLAIELPLNRWLRNWFRVRSGRTNS